MMFDFFKTMTLGVAKISEFLNFIEDLAVFTDSNNVECLSRS